MSTITKERAAGIARGEKCYTHDDVVELASIALASLEAEPVAFVMADDLKESSIISTPAYRDLGEAMERTVGDLVALHAIPPSQASLEARDKLSNFFASQEPLGKDFEKVLAENIEGLYVPDNSAPPAPVVPAELHPETQKLVTNFCTALAEKLYKAQIKYGYDADWKQDGWPTQCQSHFHQHIAKGDPRDVASYCAFMWYHGWKTEPAPVSVLDLTALDNLAGEMLNHAMNCERRVAVAYTHCAHRLAEEVRDLRAAMLQGAENAESPTAMKTASSMDSSPKIAESPSGNSPVIPECSCHTCRPVTFADSRFVVCPECGNKRCPHANDHRNACTGSNEPGQEGSAYPAAPQQEVK